MVLPVFQIWSIQRQTKRKTARLFNRLWILDSVSPAYAAFHPILLLTTQSEKSNNSSVEPPAFRRFGSANATWFWSKICEKAELVILCLSRIPCDRAHRHTRPTVPDRAERGQTWHALCKPSGSNLQRSRDTSFHLLGFHNRPGTQTTCDRCGVLFDDGSAARIFLLRQEHRRHNSDVRRVFLRFSRSSNSP